MEQRDLTGLVIDNQIEILESIGEGGMGAVYRAHHRGWNQPMAVKVPHHHLLQDPSERERFLLEANTWIDLGIHPHIVTCWFIHPWDGIPLLFLDLLEGGNLRDEIRQGRLHFGDWERILALAIQACDGLAHAHQLGLIHRDIKPANLLLDKSGRLCVTDFGLVKNLAHSVGANPLKGPSDQAFQQFNMSLTTTGIVIGTPHYASPEQWLQDDRLTVRADLYSLGVVLYEMAVGRVPFDPPSGPQAVGSLFVSHTTQAPPDPAEQMADIPRGLRDVIMSCMAKEPSKRPASAREMRDRLSEVYRETTGKPYDEVPQAAQQRADSLNNKAVSLWNLGKRPLALTAWTEALSFDALHPESVFNRAMVQWLEGKLEPEEVIRRLQTVRATHPRAAAYLGLFELTRGQPFEAEIQIKTALQSEESSTDTRLWKALGDCQMISERYVEAQESYRRSLELSSQQIDVVNRLKLATAQRSADLDRSFPRSRPIWETVLASPAREVYMLPDRLLCLQDLAVTALKLSDGSIDWKVQLFETPRLEIMQELNLWTVAPRPNDPLYRQSDGKLETALSENDKLFAYHPPSGRMVIGNIDLWIGELTAAPAAVKHLTKMAGHDKQVSAAAFSPSGDRVATGGYDRRLVIWSTRNGNPLHTVQRHKDFIESVAISPDGKLVASGSRDRSVRITSIDSGESYRELKDHPSAVVRVRFTPDSKKLLAWCGAQGITTHALLWDLTDGSLIKRFEGRCHVTQDGEYLMVGRQVSGSPCLDICRLDSLAWTRTFPADSPVVASDDSSDGRLLAYSTQQGTVGLWEFSEKSRLMPAGLHLTRVRSYGDLESSRASFQEHMARAQAGLDGSDFSVAWLELEKARGLAGYYRDPAALAVAAQLLKRLPRESLRSIWEQRVVRDTSDLPIGPTLWMDDGGLAISSAGKWLRVWNAQTGSCVRGMVGHSETVTALDSTKSKALSATTGKDVRLWDLQTGECEKRFAAPSLGISWLKMNPAMSKAVLFSIHQDLSSLDLSSGKTVNTVRMAGVSLIAASDDLATALAGGSPGQACLSIWNLNSGKKTGDEKKFLEALKKRASSRQNNESPPNGESGPDYQKALQVSALSVRVNGGFGLTASLDNYIRLWDLQNLRCLEEYFVNAQCGPVSALAWSQDGQHFVSGHNNGSLRVWARNRTQGPIKGVEGHWGKVLSASLSTDARFLFTVLEDRTLRFWELDWSLNPKAVSRSLRAIYPRPGFLSRLFGGR